MLLSDIYLLFSSLSCCLVHDNSKQEKDYALLLSFVGQARLQFAGLHSLFLALWCTVIEIGGTMMDLLFWDLMYLYPGFICCLRCLCDNRCICKAWYSLLQMLFLRPMYIRNLLFFKLADTFQPACHVQLHLHRAFSGIWGCFLWKFCIYIPRFR